MTNSTFDAFWEVWKPIRSGLSDDKKKAEEKYWKARKTTPHEVILEGAIRYRDHCEAKGIDKPFRKMAKTWLHNECWESDLDTTPGALQSDGSSPKLPPCYQREFKPRAHKSDRLKLQLEAHDVMRKRGEEPAFAPIEKIEAVMRELADRRQAGGQ